MELKTKRLILREFGKRKTDVTDIVEGANNINVTKWLLVLPCPYKKKDAIWWINHCKEKKKKKESFDFAIELKSEKKLIGGIGLSSIKKDQGTATIGYWLNEKYHKQGFGTEALKSVLDLPSIN